MSAVTDPTGSRPTTSASARAAVTMSFPSATRGYVAMSSASSAALAAASGADRRGTLRAVYRTTSPSSSTDRTICPMLAP